jgi:hypothetical protein
VPNFTISEIRTFPALLLQAAMSTVFAVFFYPFYQAASHFQCLVRVDNFKMYFSCPWPFYLVNPHSRPTPGLPAALAFSTVSTLCSSSSFPHSIGLPVSSSVYSMSTTLKSLFLVLAFLLSKASLPSMFLSSGSTCRPGSFSIVFPILVYPFYQPSSHVHCLVRVTDIFENCFRIPRIIYLVKSHSHPVAAAFPTLLLQGTCALSPPSSFPHSISSMYESTVYSVSSSTSKCTFLVLAILLGKVPLTTHSLSTSDTCCLGSFNTGFPIFVSPFY